MNEYTKRETSSLRERGFDALADEAEERDTPESQLKAMTAERDNLKTRLDESRTIRDELETSLAAAGDATQANIERIALTLEELVEVVRHKS